MNEAEINQLIVMMNKAFADEFAKTVYGNNEDGTTYMVVPFGRLNKKWILVQRFDSFGEMEESETFQIKWEDDIIEKAETILAFATK